MENDDIQWCEEDKYEFDYENEDIQKNIEMIEPLIGNLSTEKLSKISKFLCMMTFNKNSKQDKILKRFYVYKYEHIYEAKKLSDYIDGNDELQSNVINVYNYIKSISFTKLLKVLKDINATYGKPPLSTYCHPKFNIIKNIIKSTIVHNISIADIIKLNEE